MGQRAQTMSASVAILSSLAGMALIVQLAGVRNPPVYPITGIFFLVVSLSFLCGLVGMVWDTLTNDVRAANLIWSVVGATLGCGIIAFYSVGFFFLISALNWGTVALIANWRETRPVRHGVLLALVITGFFVVVLSFMRGLPAD